MLPYSKKVIQHFTNPKNFGKIKNADGIGHVGNPHCLPPEALVFSNPSVKAIQEFKVQDKVIGHDGLFHKVKKVFERNFRGKLYSIKVHNLGETNLTGEHPVLCLRTSGISKKFKEYKNYLPEWENAEYLKKGDIILYPVLRENKNVKFIQLNIKKSKWDFKSKKLPLEISVNNNFLRLMGYYLSEGYVRTNPSQGTLGFTFRDTETKYIRDVIYIMRKIFKLTPASTKTEHNCTRIIFYSAGLARFFMELCGKGAANKHLPHWVITMPPEQQSHLLNGLWRGDGYINSKRAMFVTISEHLARQLEILLLRQKIIFSFLIEPARGMHKKNYRFYVQDDSSLEKLIKFTGAKIKIIKSPNKKNNPHSWFDKDYYYTTISKIVSMAIKGVVFNLEVEGSQSFITNSLALHNCGDMMDIYIKVDKKNGKEIIKDIKFETYGCAAAIATSDVACDLVKGKALDEALGLTHQDIVKELDELPAVKVHCSVLAHHGLKAAVDDYRKKQK